MAIDVSDVAYGASSLILVLFAGWLLYLSPRQRATRALATLLCAIGFVWSSEFWSELLSVEMSIRILGVYPAALTVLGLATVYFLCVYPRPRGWIGRSPASGYAFLAAGAAISAIFLIFPGIWGVPVLENGEWVAFEEGPATPVNNVWTMTSALLLVAFAVEHVRTPEGPVRRGLSLIMGAFIASTLLWQTSLVLNDLGGRLTLEAISPPIVRVNLLLEEFTAVATLAAPAILLVAALRSSERSRRHEGFGVAMLALAAIVAATITWWFTPPPEPGHWTSSPQQVLDAFGGLVIAMLAGYALLRHRLFDIDVKLRWTISRGTVAVLFVGVFFIASQMAQNFLEDSMGWALGGITAGLMLFAIAPIQRAADRVADVALPRRALDAREAQLETYRLALQLALADRVITRAEERHLAHLAQHLGIPHVDALDARYAVEVQLGIAREAAASAEQPIGA